MIDNLEMLDSICVLAKGSDSESAEYINMESIYLNLTNLSKISSLGVPTPTYIRPLPGSPTIIHMSVGGFHRAHQAFYLDKLLQSDSADRWRLVGVGLLPFDIPARDAMRTQDCLYTLVERDETGHRARIIGSICNYLYAPAQREEVLSAMADESCKIVSLTITEGGYFIDQRTGKFNNTHPDIVHDLENIGEPKSSFGYMIAALKSRRDKGLLPFTVQSCDNLQNNGNVPKEMLLSFANLVDPSLASWLETQGAFPNSMVDRITPATTDQHRQLVKEKFGIIDAWPVTCEPFCQWVIEDKFVGNRRPKWELVGAHLTPDVEPYELMKIRLLNGSHQALCYIGMLLGYRFAPEAMADTRIRNYLKKLMDEEVSPLLHPVPGVDLEEYKMTLLKRFANPAVNDQLLRIGTDGSTRIPKFVLPSIRETLLKGTEIKLLCFVPASWIYYLNQDVDVKGQALQWSDPLIGKVREQAQSGLVSVIDLEEVFGDLGCNQKFRETMTEILSILASQGVEKALANII